ncbi:MULTISPECIES: type II toxin-antitoxin system ParD family antitoxin [unclassified Aureimonas]|uniref:type II toxin-antitoxin system ParD family antitoxin n=1 Tax=unclassified Aureimonas TaxID=2615206 RepID=UPI0007004450|nr:MULTISPECIES: type II toxin-antitoxin system ParD family antitoxin [unclassified Aureimonas]KQT65793.1 hypothetical protein ASG62_21730 [Aureimonas sp. Leaf427]KQT74792.1 hypothetical protein ASG54_16790 [Aureimonas sp. Leaf460]
MATIHLSLPEPMTEWVRSQARSGRYESADDYLHALIRRDQERSAAISEIQALATEGLESGISDEPFGETIAKARRTALERSKA